MGKKKVILVVLDGLDYKYITTNIESFTLFKEWYNSGRLKVLNSVVPADSIPSWITIYTGVSPAEHGVLETIDYLDKKQKIEGKSAVIKGKSFWDKLSNKGKKVYIFNPFIASPAWDVNGLMVCRSSLEGKNEITTNRKDIIDVSGLDLGGNLKKNPTKKQIHKFLKDTWIMTDSQFNNFHRYFKTDTYDFAFLGVTTPDRLQHIMWKYTDESDRCFVKRSDQKNSILDGYKYFEKQIQKIVDSYSENYNIVIISDHGHGKRCENTFYINQWLIDNKFIPDKGKKKRFIEYCKNLILYIMAKLHIVQHGTNFLKKFKVLHKVKNADHIFKKKGAIYVPNFDGVNPFGGISLNKECYKSVQEYEKKRQEIIDKLLLVKHKNKEIMEWVKRREEIYPGNTADNYPDIVYKMDNNYGVDRGLFGHRWFGISAFHEIISGGHRYEGVIMGNDGEVFDDVHSVLDIHQMIMKQYEGMDI